MSKSWIECNLTGALNSLIAIDGFIDRGWSDVGFSTGDDRARLAAQRLLDRRHDPAGSRAGAFRFRRRRRADQKNLPRSQAAGQTRDLRRASQPLAVSRRLGALPA